MNQFCLAEYLILAYSLEIWFVDSSLIVLAGECYQFGDVSFRYDFIIFLLIAVFLVAIVQNLFQFLISRLAIGILYGVILPISRIIIAEIVPSEQRGRYLVGLQFTFIIGYVWTIILAYLFMENLMEGNWRAIALCNTFPCLICLIGTLIYLQEPPRLFICQGKMLELDHLVTSSFCHRWGFQRLHRHFLCYYCRNTAVAVVYFVIDLCGRIPIELISNVLNIVAIFAVWRWREYYLMVGLIVFKFFFRISILAFLPLVVESYSTPYRSMGIGTTTALGRMVGFIAPAIVFPIYEQDHYLPFFYAGLCLVAFTIVLSTFPKDLTRKPLDGPDDQKLD